MPELKLFDKAVIIISLLGIIISFIYFNVYGGKIRGGKYLEIYSQNKKTEYSLQDADIRIKGEQGEILIKVRDGRAKVVESACADGWCKGMGWIENPGESIVCLPLKVFITIRRKDSQKDSQETPYIDAVTR